MLETLLSLVRPNLFCYPDGTVPTLVLTGVRLLFGPGQ